MRKTFIPYRTDSFPRKFDPKVQGSKRPPVDIAKAEIGKAIEMIVGEARSITPKELEKKNTQFLWLGLHIKRREAIDQFFDQKNVIRKTS